MDKDRKFAGKHWTPRYLRSIQCILQATHGVVSPRREFFEAAFGKNIKEFRRLLIMPDKYIIYRRTYENNGAVEWASLLNSLSSVQKNDFFRIVNENKFDGNATSEYPEVSALLAHYKKGKAQVSEESVLF
jgi:hypothetical protein